MGPPRPGHARGLVGVVEPLLQQSGVHMLDEPAVHPWPEVYAEALVAVGRLDDAEAVLAPLEAAATTLRRSSAMAHAARVRAKLLAARGDATGAEESFRAALAHVDRVAAPFDASTTTCTPDCADAAAPARPS